jgi:hypothetical protein
VSIQIVLTPLTDRGPGLLDALEARTGKLAWKVEADTGARTYSLASESEVADFDQALAQIESGWQIHLGRAE